MTDEAKSFLWRSALEKRRDADRSRFVGFGYLITLLLPEANGPRCKQKQQNRQPWHALTQHWSCQKIAGMASTLPKKRMQPKRPRQPGH